MKEIVLKFPDELDIQVNEISMIVASKLYEQGKLSLGQAAEITGLSKRVFAELLGKFNVSIFNSPSDELVNDVLNA